MEFDIESYKKYHVILSVHKYRIKTTGAFTTEKCWDQIRPTSAKQEMQFVLLITEHVFIYFNAMKNIRYVLKPEQFPKTANLYHCYMRAIFLVN